MRAGVEVNVGDPAQPLDEDDSTPAGGRRSEPSHAEARRARWRRTQDEELDELDPSIAEDLIRRSARLDRQFPRAAHNAMRI